MLRHVILLLFLIGLSLPAVAMPVEAGAPEAAASCHDAAPAGSHHRDDGKDKSKAAGHFCIGCVAAPAASIIAAPARIAAIAPHIQPMTALAGADIAPSIPPPRP